MEGGALSNVVGIICPCALVDIWLPDTPQTRLRGSFPAPASDRPAQYCHIPKLSFRGIEAKNPEVH